MRWKEHRSVAPHGANRPPTVDWSRGTHRRARAPRHQSPQRPHETSAAPKTPRRYPPGSRDHCLDKYARQRSRDCRRAARKTPAAYSSRPRPRPESLPGFPPLAAIALEQIIRFPRSPGARGIIGEIPRRQRLPHVENRLHNAPTRLDHVRPLKQRRVTDHAFIEQTLISSARLGAEIIRVAEIHIHGAQLHDRAWDFRAKLQRNSFLGLNVHDELIGREA